ncbi:MAG: hypothetical protein R6U25_13330 [Alkalispirochaeta sp.]
MFRISRSLSVAAVGGLLLIAAVTPTVEAQVAVGATPALGIYSGEFGFEAQAHADWRPPFLAGLVPDVLLSGLAGVSRVETQNEDDANVVILGFLGAIGVHYEFIVGRVELRPGIYGGIQVSTFDGIDADNETVALVAPHGEVAFPVFPNITAGLYVASKLLFYDALEASVTIGPRIRYRF